MGGPRLVERHGQACVRRSGHDQRSRSMFHSRRRPDGSDGRAGGSLTTRMAADSVMSSGQDIIWTLARWQDGSAQCTRKGERPTGAEPITLTASPAEHCLEGPSNNAGNRAWQGTQNSSRRVRPGRRTLGVHQRGRNARRSDVAPGGRIDR